MPLPVSHSSSFPPTSPEDVPLPVHPFDSPAFLVLLYKHAHEFPRRHRAVSRYAVGPVSRGSDAGYKDDDLLHDDVGYTGVLFGDYLVELGEQDGEEGKLCEAGGRVSLEEVVCISQSGAPNKPRILTYSDDL